MILLKGLAIAATVALPSSSLYSSSITSSNVIQLTNQARRNLGLEQLEANDLLARAAQAKADDMLANQYFAHTSPAGVTPWDWFSQVGYRYLYAGENLAVHYTTAEDVGEGWMASPSHRANIVNPSYTEIGIGIAYGTFEGAPSYLVVQMFGSPLPQLAEAAPAPEVATLPPVPAPAVPVAEPKPEVASAAVEAAPAPTVATPATAELQTTVPTVAPAIDPASLQLQQRPGLYSVSIEVADAQAVEVQLAGERAALTRIGQSDLWDGSVVFNAATLSVGGEQLTVSATGQSGSTVSQSVAWVAPATEIQQLYNFNGNAQKAIKLLGISIGNLNDSTRQVYLYFLVFLGVALLLNVAIKHRVQHPTIIGHGAAVMALAVILFLV